MEPWRRLDRASADEVRAILMSCCGSTRWVERMLTHRPFASREALLDAARIELQALEPFDWREAFGHHPKIGDREALRTRFGATRHLSEKEQAGVTGASDAVIDALAAGNREYEERFGYIFIVCATGKSADEMLSLLRDRLTNDPEREILVAAEEQAKITAIRLESMT
jgi:2-oxo-4-hydroxy-4-carboxy-5-ureidoimidazoline decarboxylase